MRSRFVNLSLVGALLSAVGLVGVTADAPPASASSTPITIAFVTSLTGAGSAEFSQSPQAFLARIDLANAQGGVNGHKLVPLVLDDQTSPTEVVTAVQDALSKGAFGIVSDSPLFFSAAKYPQQAGVPVTGGSFDGPEWGEQPYTNMFASDTGSVDPKYPVNTGIGQFLKSHGGTVVGSYGYSISPSSTRSAIGTAQSMVDAGGKVGVLDTAVPFGGVDFTTPALVAKSKHVNAVYAGMDNNSNFALATSMKQAGVKLKVVVYPTGYESDVVHSPAWQNVQGDYFDSEFRPFALPNAGTEQMAAALQKYEHWSPKQFPNFSQYEAWLGADLMIKGLQLAGKNPTQAAVIHDLRHLTSYNGDGLLPNPIDYSTIFGHDLPKECGWYMIARSQGFVPSSTQPVCGTDIPGTTTVSGS
jgi:branched-chain amino acid transport system substrate-binding protein